MTGESLLEEGIFTIDLDENGMGSIHLPSQQLIGAESSGFPICAQPHPSTEDSTSNSADLFPVAVREDAPGENPESTFFIDQIKELKAEIDHLQLQLQQERVAREVVANVSQRADKSLAKVLADAWRAVEEEKQAHELTTTQAAEVLKECQYFKMMYHMIERERHQEMVSAKAAHKALKAAEEALAQVKEENENLLSQLVKVKLDFANKCMEQDELERRHSEALRLLVLAQKRIDDLEDIAKAKLVQHIGLDESEHSDEHAFTESSI